MKTIQVCDDATVILANEMSGDEVIAFLDKWKAAIERGDKFMFADVVVLGELKQNAKLMPEQIDQQFIEGVNRLSQIYWHEHIMAEEDFRRGMQALFDKTCRMSKATLTGV